MKTIAIILSAVIIPAMFITTLANNMPKVDEGRTMITVRQEYLKMR